MSSGLHFKLTIPLFLSFSLAACGGGSGFGIGSGSGDTTTDTDTTGTDDTSSVTISSLRLSASSRQLLSDGSEPVTISALAKDANNNLISDAGIVFSVNNDADLPTPTGDTLVTAELTPGTPVNRQLTVTASAGGIQDTLLVDVVGTTVAIEGPSRIAINDATDYTLKVADAGNNELGYQPVSLPSISSGNCSVSSTQQNANGGYETDSKGEFIFQVTGTTGGSCVIDASALGATEQKSVDISGDVFTISPTTTAGSDNTVEVPLSTSETITLRLEQDGSPKAGEIITLSATRGQLPDPAQVTTNSFGEASFDISSARAGTTVITATTTDGLTAVIDNLEFVATTPAYISTQSSPTLIQPNGNSTIITQIRDINDNPVKNMVINFTLDDSVNGVLSSSMAETDSLGRASVVYTAGNSTSEKDGVIINTFIQGYSSITDTTTLTVGGDALRIVLGSDNLVSASSVYYEKDFGVIVTDSSGNPIADQAVDFTISPDEYHKGVMVPVDTDGDGEADRWAKDQTAACENEDMDRDGQLDSGEDINHNGTLEPSNDATVTTGSGVTDESGSLVVTVRYPKSRALWSRQTLIATTNVGGTEFGEQTSFVLPILEDDVSDPEISPPNHVSPYGYSSSCTDSL